MKNKTTQILEEAEIHYRKAEASGHIKTASGKGVIRHAGTDFSGGNIGTATTPVAAVQNKSTDERSRFIERGIRGSKSGLPEGNQSRFERDCRAYMAQPEQLAITAENDVITAVCVFSRQYRKT